MWPGLQVKVKEVLVVLEALVASVDPMKETTLVKAGIFHNVIVCCKFCVAFPFNSILNSYFYSNNLMNINRRALKISLDIIQFAQNFTQTSKCEKIL